MRKTVVPDDCKNVCKGVFDIIRETKYRNMMRGNRDLFTESIEEYNRDKFNCLRCIDKYLSIKKPN